VRIRSAVALSAAALLALTLAGCSGASSGGSSPSASAADLCSARVSSGKASAAVKVSGDLGKEATVTFTAPLDVTATESTTVTKGTGDKLAAGDLVQFALTEYNAQTGAKNGALGQSDGELLPQQISADSVLGKVLGCATVGTRVVATIPGDETSPASVDVVDVLKIVPSKAWGTPQAPQAGFPTVKLAKNGAPTITIPKTDAPTAVEQETLKKGDGATVGSGDTVLVQYTGVLWKDGTVFDSSWKNGQPANFATTDVVKGFQQALEGATVGSQVLVVIPPAEGYGDQAQGAIPANSTLVFVIDILGSQKAAPAQ
jgi:hypothetical protein